MLWKRWCLHLPHLRYVIMVVKVDDAGAFKSGACVIVQDRRSWNIFSFFKSLVSTNWHLICYLLFVVGSTHYFVCTGAIGTVNEFDLFDLFAFFTHISISCFVLPPFHADKVDVLPQPFVSYHQMVDSIECTRLHPTTNSFSDDSSYQCVYRYVCHCGNQIVCACTVVPPQANCKVNLNPMAIKKGTCCSSAMQSSFATNTLIRTSMSCFQKNMIDILVLLCLCCVGEYTMESGGVERMEN